MAGRLSQPNPQHAASFWPTFPTATTRSRRLLTRTIRTELARQLLKQESILIFALMEDRQNPVAELGAQCQQIFVRPGDGRPYFASGGKSPSFTRNDIEIYEPDFIEQFFRFVQEGGICAFNVIEGYCFPSIPSRESARVEHDLARIACFALTILSVSAYGTQSSVTLCSRRVRSMTLSWCSKRRRKSLFPLQ